MKKQPCFVGASEEPQAELIAFIGHCNAAQKFRNPGFQPFLEHKSLHAIWPIFAAPLIPCAHLSDCIGSDGAGPEHGIVKRQRFSRLIKRRIH
jgi:hypothetical protein